MSSSQVSRKIRGFSPEDPLSNTSSRMVLGSGRTCGKRINLPKKLPIHSLRPNSMELFSPCSPVNSYSENAAFNMTTSKPSSPVRTIKKEVLSPPLTPKSPLQEQSQSCSLFTSSSKLIKEQPSSTKFTSTTATVSAKRMRPSSPSKKGTSPTKRPEHVFGSRSRQQAGSPPPSSPSSKPAREIVVDGMGTDKQSKKKFNIKIPQKLPRPPIQVVSNPENDLVAHFLRHGLVEEAKQVANSPNPIPASYFLSAYLSLGQMGKSSLYDQTIEFAPKLQAFLYQQIHSSSSSSPSTGDTKTEKTMLPKAFELDVSLDSCGSWFPPTHFFAIHETGQTETAILYPIHVTVAALQCTSIPFFPTYSETDQHIRTMPIVSLPIPEPKHFGITYRWLYSNSDSFSLFRDLIPMRYVVRYLSTISSSSSSSTKTKPKDATPQDVVESLSHLSTPCLLDLLQRIQAVWKNGSALGILDFVYWSQIEKAWEYSLAALVLAKRRKSNSASIEVTRIHLNKVSLSSLPLSQKS